MKKQLLNLSVIAVFIAIANVVLADPLVQPVRELEIPFAGNATMTMDGIDDEAVYSAEQSTAAFNPTGSTGADADYTLTFKVAYDHTYLYMYGVVLDDYDNSVEYTTTGNPWEFDNNEVFLNLDTAGSMTAAYDSNTIQLRINRGIDSIQTPGRATQEEYINYWENTASGWLHETAIPWTAVLGDGQVPEDIMNYLDAIHGFDISGADSDTDGPGARDCQTAWDMDDPDDPADRTEDNAWNNRTVFGIMTLEPGTAVDNYTTSSLDIYPNPANSLINFDVEGAATVRIYSITGVEVMVVENAINSVDISSLKSGLYVIQINGKSARFVKE